MSEVRSVYQLKSLHPVGLDHLGALHFPSCACVQSIDYSLVCKWFRAAVLPTDKGLCAALLHQEQVRPCAECGTMFVPLSNRGKYCDECAAIVRWRQKAAHERERRRRGHLEP